jgi:ribosomal protein L37AE/L43A
MAENPYQSPEESSPPLPPDPRGRHFAPCPQCGNTFAKRTTEGEWDLIANVKCLKCGKNYNGKTGDSNSGAIAFYTALAMAAAVAILIVKILIRGR